MGRLSRRSGNSTEEKQQLGQRDFSIESVIFANFWISVCKRGFLSVFVPLNVKNTPCNNVVS